MNAKVTVKSDDAPEGGWGWFVVFAYALNNVVIIPMVQIFGLLYRDLLLYDLQMSNVQISTIITINCTFGMLLAIFNGPVLKIFSFRKVAIFGALLTFFGNLCTSQAETFWQFIIYFSIFVSVGMNFSMAAFHLALNTYFKLKRGVATGIAMSITGLGPIFMPLLVGFLMSEYGVRGSGMILSGIVLHSLIGALLLRPVKHAEKKIDEIEIQTINSAEQKDEEKNVVTEKPDEKKDEEEPTVVTKLMTDENLVEVNLKAAASDAKDEETSPPPKSLDDVVKRYQEPFWKRGRIIKFFDLDLLKDPIYLNISLGLSLAFIAEMNFTLMIPFILPEFHFNTKETAILMSILAVADILSRFMSPFIDKSGKSRVRIVYLGSLTSGIFFRICLLGANSFTYMAAVIFALGITKGIRTVYTALVTPTYVPLNKLASATGLQMVSNGLFFAIFGPLMGLIREKSGNYVLWIHVINCFTICTIIMWFVELYFVRKKKKPKKPIVIRTER